ncbi:MAG: LPS export ABC transporter periplasmic protein LptC, partial [Flavobacteriaceae bacterium]|nr:LPS export ABC transporter periplasmic protein LptC [Flavobacteriaceae bacterium]
VRIESHDGKIMEADQFYWDQGNSWIFTEQKYKLTSPDINLEGVGIDFNRNFTYVYTPYQSGNYTIKEEEQ